MALSNLNNLTPRLNLISTPRSMDHAAVRSLRPIPHLCEMSIPKVPAFDEIMFICFHLETYPLCGNVQFSLFAKPMTCRAVWLAMSRHGSHLRNLAK